MERQLLDPSRGEGSTTRRGARRLVALALAAGLAAVSCTATNDEPASTPPPTAVSSPGASPTEAQPEPTDSASEAPDAADEQAVRQVSVLGLAEATHRGDRLRLGGVREQTASYTSYNVTYRSRSTSRGDTESYTISGVLNVPKGKGPFPAAVLAHGYIDPAVYVRGQGMTRERAYLAARGYIAMHVDYRNHAESDDDPKYQQRMRLGYSADVINAVKALRESADVPVDDQRIALFGRSMGGGVILKVLAANPGLVQAAAPWASVSSLEAQNFNRFQRPDPEDSPVVAQLARRWGLPEDNPDFWRENSSRPYFDRITEPVLLVHGRSDDTCPPRWAAATHRALTRAGANSTLQWYDDEHAFGPAFNAAMDRTIRFFNAQLGRVRQIRTTAGAERAA